MEDCEYYIHDTYIADGGWKESAWTALMGSATLVDLVNAIWNLAANAVTIVKQAATNVLNAVKSGMEWIANAALQLIIDGIITAIDLILSTIFILVESVFGIVFTKVGSIYSKDGLNYGIESNNLGMKLHLGDFTIDFSSFFEVVEPKFETLAVLDYRVTNAILYSTLIHLVTNLLLPVAAQAQPVKAVPIAAGFTIASVAGQFWNFAAISDLSFSPDEYEYLELYYLITGLSALGSAMVSYSSKAENVFTFAEWISLVVGLGLAGILTVGSAANAYVESTSTDVGSSLKRAFNSVITFAMVVLTGWIGLLYGGFTTFSNQKIAVSTGLGIFNLANGLLFLVFRGLLNKRLI